VSLSAFHYRYFETPARRSIMFRLYPFGSHHGSGVWPADDAHGLAEIVGGTVHTISRPKAGQWIPASAALPSRV